tara:strand:+ start:1090 stop:1701 length:612 start_codon:yes stop_codon:yes gene_type:complete
MAENKKSFVAYCDWGAIFDELSDIEAGKLAKHLFNYVRDKNPKSDKITSLMFIPIMQTLKRDLKKYESYVEKQRINGLKGGRPEKPKEPKPYLANPLEPKKGDSVSVSVSDSVTVKELKDFDIARKLHRGTKRGNETEFEDFKKKYKDYKTIIPLLQPAIESQIEWRAKTTDFIPHWKNFKTWINQRCWEDETPNQPKTIKAY